MGNNEKLTDKIVKKLEHYKDVEDNDITTTSFRTVLLKEIYFLLSYLLSENEQYKADKEEYVKDYEELENKLKYAEADRRFEQQRVLNLQAENERLRSKITEEEELLSDRIKDAVNSVSKANQKYADALEDAFNHKIAALEKSKFEIIEKFAKDLIERFSNLEYTHDRITRKTVKTTELVRLVNWALHIVTTNTINNLLNEVRGEDNEY